MASAISQVASVCVGASQVIVQFAPVPWLAPAVNLVATLIAMIDQAHANKCALAQLQERCVGFLNIIRQKGEIVPAEQWKLVADAECTLQSVVSLIKIWCSKNRLELFLKQRALMGVIQDCYQKIQGSIDRLQLSFAMDGAAWQSDSEKRADRDHKEIMDFLSNITNKLSIVDMAKQLPGDETVMLMGKMQEMLPIDSAKDTPGLGNNLYDIQVSTKHLLPTMRLRFQGEIQRIGEPVYRTASVDVWEGLYLNSQKVAIKMLRTVHATPKTLKRFEREVEVWKRVWDVDQGNRILPLYGFSQDDGGHFPYVVSPWPENGTADEYVKRVPQTDHLALIRGICAGICVLHTMEPAIIHGEIRGSNVVIDGSGNPLLANFGFARVIQDAQGVAISHTVGQDFARWMAPELSSEEGSLTTSTDIYSFGMTILELMTHDKPWATVRASHQVILKASLGKKPARPQDPNSVARGLDDRLWAIMLQCWDQNESQRPCATELLQMLEGKDSPEW